VVAAVLVVVPPLALAAVVLLELDQVPAVPFYAGGAILEAVGGILGIWGIARAAGGRRLLWLAIPAAILSLPGALFFGLGAAFSIGQS
jgi:hypothetical protein